MPLPTFLCVGAQKAGTSWLFEQLRRHKQLWSPPIKELHYFDHVFLERNRAWTSGHIRGAVQRALVSHLGRPGIDWSYVAYLAEMAHRDLFSEDWYRRCFERPKAQGHLCYDVTPEYGAIGAGGIAYLLQLLPAVKILYVVRDPLQRVLSQLRMNVGRRSANRSESFEPDEETLLRMAAHPDLADRGNYRQHIPPWQTLMPEGRLLILPYGQLRTDPDGFMRRIEAFLDIEPCAGYELESQVHASKKFAIPESVNAFLADLCAPQYEYLTREFGADFVARTR